MIIKVPLFLLVLITLWRNAVFSQNTVAHQWVDQILYSITNDFARPPIHARNLYHLSIAMHDAFAAYTNDQKTILLGNNWQGFESPFYGITQLNDPITVETAQNKAISYAAYRLIMWRFQNAPAFLDIADSANMLMQSLGYDVNFLSTDYVNDGPAALGNYIASQIIAFGLQDGSNEAENYANQFYTDGNPVIEPELPGNPNMIDPNRFQRILLSNAIDQAGNPIFGAPPSLAPEWGYVKPFALKEEDSQILERNGELYKVYHNPILPPYIDTNVQTGLEDFYKWNFIMVSVWQSHLDTADNVMWDISPGAIGGLDISNYPETWADYHDFYDFYNGGDISPGHSINPITGAPYEPQIVRRADYARILAEFWADGLDSETPPGHWFKIYNEISQHPLFEKKWKGEGDVLSDLEYDIKAYVLLGGTLHDAAIGAWGVKGYYDYVRPVSAIRFMGDRGQSTSFSLPNYNRGGLPLIPGYIELVYENDPLVGANLEHLHKIKLFTWRGPDYIDDPETDMAGVGWILAENWWPYQRPTFVTPPFAGYVSGHSTFSRAAAKAMHFLTGTPFFPGGMSNFVAEQNEFLEFEAGPSETIILQWATYYDASDQCSLSRIWGGIHPPIDDIPGRKIGEKVGLDASLKTDSLFALSAPYVQNLEINIPIVNQSNTGQLLEFTIDFSQDMNLSYIPEIVTPVFNLSEVLEIENQQWINDHVFQLTYLIMNNEVNWGHIPFSIIGGKGLNDLSQKPVLFNNTLYIDTKAPEIANVQFDIPAINVNTSFLCVTLTFDEVCNPDFVPELSWYGNMDLTNYLTLDSNVSFWVNDSTYQACFSLAFPIGLESTYLTLNIENVVDIYENLNTEIIVLDVLHLDTEKPEISVQVNQNLLATADIGNEAITFTISANKAMQTTAWPVLSFEGADGTINSLEFNSFVSNWTNPNSCVLVYNLLDEPVDFTSIHVSISNIFDLAFNTPEQSLFNDLFTIDTKEPEILSATSNYSVINDACAQEGDFHIDIVFSEAMEMQTFLPLVFLKNEQGNVLADISYNIFQSYWIDAQTYRIRFNIQDLNNEVASLKLEVTLARDASLNMMVPFTSLDFINLDTRNPHLIDIEISETSLNQLTNTVSITSSFDEPMNPVAIPSFSALYGSNEHELFTPISEQGAWIDAYTYQGNYAVNHFYYQGSVDLKPLNATDLASNPIVDTTINNILELDFLYLSLNSKKLNEYRIYPNPIKANDEVHILLPNKHIAVRTILFFDLQGKKVFELSNPDTEQDKITISTQALATGLYMIQIIDSQGVYFDKLQISTP